MMNNTDHPDHPFCTVRFLDLDVSNDLADDATATDVLTDAKEWAVNAAGLDPSKFTVALIAEHGSAGGAPVVRFMSEDWFTLARLLDTYEAEAEG